MSEPRRCNICRRPLTQGPGADTEDCGGTCLRCMAEAGDPECVVALAEIEAKGA